MLGISKEMWKTCLLKQKETVALLQDVKLIYPFKEDEMKRTRKMREKQATNEKGGAAGEQKKNNNPTLHGWRKRPS